MANYIQIRRSNTSSTPANTLTSGELAYTYAANSLYIGAQTGISGAGFKVGGAKYIYLDRASVGNLTANAVVIADGNSFVSNTFTSGLVISQSTDSPALVINSVSDANYSNTVLGTLQGNNELVTANAIAHYVQTSILSGGVYANGAPSSGSNGAIQYNDQSSGFNTIAGAPNMIYDNAAGTLKVGNTSSYVLSGYITDLQATQENLGNQNNYVQAMIHNDNTGIEASADWVAYNDDQSYSSFIDMGIVSTNYSNATSTITPAGTSYLYTGNSSLVIGTSNANYVSIFTGGILAANERMRFDSTGNVAIGTTDTSNATFIVKGTAEITGGLFANGGLGSNGYVLHSNGTSMYWDSPVAGAAGANTQITYNDSGYANGSTSFTFNKSSNTLTVNGTINTVAISANGSLGSDGQALHSNGTSLYWANVTAVAGSNTYIQFNDSGLTNATAGFTFDKTINALSLGTTSVGYSVNFADSNTYLAASGNNIILTTGAAWDNEYTNRVAIGNFAGNNNQNSYAIAIGSNTGSNTQGISAIAIGTNAGANSQQDFTIAIGANAGFNSQQVNAVAIGLNAGLDSQQEAVAIGSDAGYNNQRYHSIAIGAQAGSNNQYWGSIAIGRAAGTANQSSEAIALGHQTGSLSQNTKAIAIGGYAGYANQGANSIAIGFDAGNSYQSYGAVAIGLSAGATSQGYETIAIGESAGANSQTYQAVAIGYNAGANTQSERAVAIGYYAGSNTQGIKAVAIGRSAGEDQQGQDAVALGHRAGQSTQAYGAIAIGRYAGQINQGSNSIAIGVYAGQTNQVNNSIILNASGSALDATTTGLFINPVRNLVANSFMYYNPSTKEITYASADDLPLASSLSVGNSTVNTVINSTSITTANVLAGKMVSGSYERNYVDLSVNAKLYGGNYGVQIQTSNSGGVGAANSFVWDFSPDNGSLNAPGVINATSFTINGNLTANSLGIYLGTGTYLNAASVNATSLGVNGDAIITGNLTVQGTLTTIDTTQVAIADINLKLASNNAGDVVDFGLYGQYKVGTNTYFSGLFRDHTMGDANNAVYHLYSTNTEPGMTSPYVVDGTANGYHLSTLMSYLDTGKGFVANSTTVALTANATVNVAITANTLYLSSALPANSGGTGLATYLAGDIVYASGTYDGGGQTSTTLTTLSVPIAAANDQILMIKNNIPAYSDTIDGGTF